jgi:hypothetical protein
MIGDIHYLNCGDWVESCTAIGERFDGSYEIIQWKERLADRATQAASGRWLIEAA